MALILVVLLLALLLGGLGFAIHVLWWIALIVLVIWLLGFVVRMGEGGSRGRWYRWLPAAVPSGRWHLARPPDLTSWRRGFRLRRQAQAGEPRGPRQRCRTSAAGRRGP